MKQITVYKVGIIVWNFNTSASKEVNKFLTACSLNDLYLVTDRNLNLPSTFSTFIQTQ